MFKNPLTRRNASTYITAGVMFVLLFTFIILMASGFGKGGNSPDVIQESNPAIENVDTMGDNLSSEGAKK